MRRRTTALLLTALLGAPALFAGAPTENAYVVRLRPGADGAKAVAKEMAASYGGSVVDAADEAFVLRLPASRARVVAADPRVQSVTAVHRGAAAQAVVTETVGWTSGVSYTYDGVGNVTQIGKDGFTYDKANRLTNATVNSVARRYDYDAFNNRTGCTQSAPNDCQGYTVDAATNRNRISGAGYDTAGNTKTWAGHTYAYDAMEMMSRDTASTRATEFVYTADDQRIAVYEVGAGWRWTVRDTGGRVLREFTSTTATSGWTWTKDYVYRDTMLLASRQPDPAGVADATTYHYHLDHLGTPRRITDNTDHIVGVHDYFAFGPEAGGGTNEPSLSFIKYTGHERDLHGSESSDTLDYMRARYDSPWLGRFLSVDPVVPLDAKQNPQHWNRYTYAYNSPLAYVDPTGKTIYNQLSPAETAILLQQLIDMTGLDLFIDANGTLQSHGQLFDQQTHKPLGSAQARADLLGAIAPSGGTHIIQSDAHVWMGINNGAVTKLNFGDLAQINTGNLPSATLNAASILMHEMIGHGYLNLDDWPGGKTGNKAAEHQFFATNPNWKGDVVNHDNKIRQELGLPQRSQYKTEQDNQNRTYIPFQGGKVYVPAEHN